ncbi:beta-xylosidase [Leptodontidium sp. MPI-SDFR-AT-0119]|nr:beta-xylosidase [Leptodontidium sp. MPI-SDFR-AT-0119]
MFKHLVLFVGFVAEALATNSTYLNPILPGFHPDPSCIFVPELDDTYFCASSSFLVFPGIPIHASRDLRSWKLISNALSRPSQLPGLNTTKRATSGIWASTLRYHDGTFYVFTTHVYGDYPKNATNRFDNLVFTTNNPYSSAAWSDPLHFNFTGYDVSPFWHDDGKVYVTGTFAWEVLPGIQMFTLDLKSGAVGPVRNIWNGTGASAPEGPHIYHRDGWYYLLIAEGGTGAGHMVSMARTQSIDGPYTSSPSNPVLTNANSTSYFQNLGHADLFQDRYGKWWGVALSVRQGPDGSYPMGRETVMTPVTWKRGEWPVFSPLTGVMNGWFLDEEDVLSMGEGSLVTAGDGVSFMPGETFKPEFVHWRFPVEESYVISPKGHEGSLQLTSSLSNLTGHDGRSAEANGQTFLARRQVDSLFKFSVSFDVGELKIAEQEVGVSVFLDQLHHYDLGFVISANNTPILRMRGITTVPAFVSPTIATLPIPPSWLTSKQLAFQIRMANVTHYTFSAGPVGKLSAMQDVEFASGLGLTWGFTGALLGVYATSNDVPVGFKTWVRDWQYEGLGQIVD